MVDALFAWLLTYLLHSTLLLGLAWAADRAGWLRRPRLAEIVWRTALFGGLVTATLQGPVQGGFDAMTRAAADASTRAMPVLPTTSRPRTLAVTSPPPSPSPAQRPPLAEPGEARGWSHLGLASLAGALDQPDEAMLENRLTMPFGEAAPVIVVPWLLFVALALVRIARAVRHIHREASACPPVRDADTLRFVHSLSPHREAPLRVTAQWSSPLVTPRGDICLPEWVFSELDTQQREAVLAHEVAHLRRRDPWWLLAAHAVAHVGWLQPLNRVALRRLDAAAELMCDDWAASRADRRHELAEALFLCAQRMTRVSAPALATTMARGSSPLLARIESLLKQRPTSLPRPMRLGLAALLGCVLGGFIALPVIAISSNTNHLRIDNSALGMIIRIDGDVTFADDDSDVRSVTDGAVFQQKVQGRTRSIQFKPDGHGGVTRLYKIDGDVHPIDADARNWLATVIPQVLRDTAWHSKERIVRIRSVAGTAAALDEIGRVSMPFARMAYIEALAASGPLDEASLTRLLGAVKATSGDFERAGAYTAVLRHQTLDAAALTLLVSDLDALREDFEKHEVLDLAAPQLAPLMSRAPALAAAYVNTTQHMSSSFDRSGALITLVHTRQLDRAGYAAVLQGAQHMQSSFDTCNVLQAVAASMPKDAELLRLYREAARDLEDFERGQAEKALDHLNA